MTREGPFWDLVEGRARGKRDGDGRHPQPRMT